MQPKEDAAIKTSSYCKRNLNSVNCRPGEPCYRTIFEKSATAMIIYGDDGQILQANSEFGRLVGCGKAEIESMCSFKELFPAYCWDEVERCDQMLTLKLAEAPLRLESKIRNRQGLEKDVVLNIALLQDGNQRIVSMIDTTESKRLQEAIMRLDQLNLVGEIAASIGHEVRNPITSIRGFLQIMREDQNYAKDKDYFDLMIEEIDRVNAIITEYLLMARAKRKELLPKNLNHILESIYPLINADARAQDKNLCMELGEIPLLMLDDQEMRQLVFNLARNGLESMPGGETLTIRTGCSEGRVVLEVIDRGGGIPAEIMDQIGQPFFTTKVNGTGLGLPVCYSIAAQHQASIHVESDQQGTCFQVCFDCSHQETR